MAGLSCLLLALVGVIAGRRLGLGVGLLALSLGIIAVAQARLLYCLRDIAVNSFLALRPRQP